MRRPPPLPAAPAVAPDPCSRRQVAREFRALLAAGARLHVAGSARHAPLSLLEQGYVPCHRLELFGTRFHLAELRQNPDVRYFVAWVQPARHGQGQLYARLFYKDVSLIWRAASHVVRTADENWIGKGDVVETEVDGRVLLESNEATTDLPLEMQDALETFARAARRVRHDQAALTRVLRNGPNDRVMPYREFSAPRRAAAADPAQRIHDGRAVAWFTQPGDPASLRFARGYAPDFARGVLAESCSDSTLYGGVLRRFRILSQNRRVQYLFFAGPRQVWIIPPQGTGRELTTFGLRPVSVNVAEDLCVPGFEYHYLDDSVEPPQWVSQIPAGHVGARSTVDPARADASPWLERLPVIQDFRREVLGERRRVPAARQGVVRR